jgi:hypothetical protein
MDPKTFENLPHDLKKSLLTDYGYSGLAALKPVPAKLATEPYTQAGASQLRGEYFDPYLDENTQGVTYNDKQGNSFVSLNPKGTDQTNTRAHEMEHVLANQGLGAAPRLNSLWDETVV